MLTRLSLLKLLVSSRDGCGNTCELLKLDDFRSCGEISGACFPWTLGRGDSGPVCRANWVNFESSSGYTFPSAVVDCVVCVFVRPRLIRCWNCSGITPPLSTKACFRCSTVSASIFLKFVGALLPLSALAASSYTSAASTSVAYLPRYLTELFNRMRAWNFLSLPQQLTPLNDEVCFTLTTPFFIGEFSKYPRSVLSLLTGGALL
mmetsp:Transcript_11906/g.19387  ORF Transcript_11906/g.19387 Transcript_11906/m.19387 type:complete len:205 (-) Transcript_11906:492-1106(-)